MELLDKKDCCGCGCCINSCPFGAIKMVRTEEGFEIPTIDKKKCKNCGLCRKRCPIINAKKYNDNNYNYYAAYSHDESILNKSSSGGIFYELASYFIKNNGIVYGAAFDNNYEVNHIKVTNLNSLEQILKSKYVQSNSYYYFKDIKEQLEQNKKILFSGTPCEIESLNNFLGKPYENLITIDFICTGVPSRRVFQEYVKHFEKKYNDKLLHMDFRNKKNGWYNYCVYMKFKNNEVYNSRFFNPLIYLQYNHISVMSKCLKCPFRNGNSSSDIQLGDLWNSYIIDNELYNKKGVSVVITKTKKGEKFYNEILNNIFSKKISKEELELVNKSYSDISFDDKLRNAFFDDFVKATEKYKIIKQYSHIPNINKIKIKKNLLILKIKGK